MRKKDLTNETRMRLEDLQEDMISFCKKWVWYFVALLFLHIFIEFYSSEFMWNLGTFLLYFGVAIWIVLGIIVLIISVVLELDGLTMNKVRRFVNFFMMPMV